MKKYDLIVVGGGFAGTSAAIAAAREGVKTLLIERTNALSGAANTMLVMPFMGYRTVIGRDENGEKIMKQLNAGILQEIVDAMKAEGRADEKGHTFDNEYLKIVLNRMAISAGVELLFNATVVSAVREGDSIRSVTVHGKGKTYVFEADYFIDATGDANIIAMTGFPFKLGREPDNLCQPMTLCFRVAGVNTEQFWADQREKKINTLYKKLQAEGKIRNPREDVLVFRVLAEGMLHFNTTRVVKLDPTDIFDVTKAEIEAREQVYEMINFLKTNFESCKKAQVVSTSLEIGVRESRMIEGEYTITGQELKTCPDFEDSIAVGNYDIDIHNPEGSGTSHYFFPEGKYYEIPYRSLIPKNAQNLLVAGRCISADHEAQASIRIMPIVCCIGQAAGVAAAVAKKQGVGVKDVDIKQVQSILTKNGAVIH